MEMIYAGVLWGAIGLGLLCILLCARRDPAPGGPEQRPGELPEA